LDSASDYHYKRCAESRKRKRSAKSTEKAFKKTKLSEMTRTESSNLEDTIVSEKLVENTSGFSNLEQHTKPSEGNNIGNEPPLLLRHVLYGINAVTKRLETQAQNARSPTIATLPETSAQPPKPLKYIFVCRADVDPALLIAHLPHLVAAYNSTRPSQYIKLIPLPLGAELVLAQTLGVRRVTVLGVDVRFLKICTNLI
jgi:ribonuclease P/MRP protein subunit POP3